MAPMCPLVKNVTILFVGTQAEALATGLGHFRCKHGPGRDEVKYLPQDFQRNVRTLMPKYSLLPEDAST